MTKIVCISDTHTYHNRMTNPIPEGDILIHAGDSTGRGSLESIQDFCKWYGSLPHRHKILISGNHDFGFEKSAFLAEGIPERFNITYLRDSFVIVEGLKIYGSPWTPRFFDWAFNLDREGDAIKAVWDLIPPDIDVLVTHGPPEGILDYVPPNKSLDAFGYKQGHVGCEELSKKIEELTNLKLHVFGHIHSQYGIAYKSNTTYVNAAICTEGYEPINAPIVVELNK